MVSILVLDVNLLHRLLLAWCPAGAPGGWSAGAATAVWLGLLRLERQALPCVARSRSWRDTQWGATIILAGPAHR